MKRSEKVNIIQPHFLVFFLTIILNVDFIAFVDAGCFPDEQNSWGRFVKDNEGSIIRMHARGRSFQWTLLWQKL